MKKLFIISLILTFFLATPAQMLAQSQDLSFSLENASQERMTLNDSLIRPAPVHNLVASTGEEPGTMILTWDAPGAEYDVGTASAYIIRHSSEPITEMEWDDATTVPDPPKPQEAGSQETMTISGLVPGQAYHFALKSQNDIPNTSHVSNNAYAVAGRMQYDYATFIPLVPSTEEVIISDNTRVLSESTTQYLSEISEDGTIFTFSQSVPELSALQAGDIIVGDVAENAPEGFLRTVTSVSTSGSQVVVNTADATLEEVIIQGSLSASGDLVPEDANNVILAPGVTMVPPDQGREEDEKRDWRFDLDRVLYKDQHGEFKIRGHLEIDMGYKFDYAFSWGLKELSFIVYDHREVELYVEGDYSRTLEKKVEIAKVYFTPITFTIGFVPVVLSPQLEIYVGVDGEVKAHFVTGVQAEFSYTAGAEWQKSEGWSIIDRGPTSAFNYTPPQLDLEASLRAYAGIQATLKLYGFVGPYVGLEGYLEFLADMNANPWWDLHVGFDVFAGIELKILSLEWQHRWTLLEYRHLLAQAPVNRPPFVPSNPTPTVGAAHVSRSILLEWSGGDPDNDPVTYDVYFQQGTSPPSMRVCEGITETTCKPCDQTPCQANDVLKDGTYYSWKVVATDRFGLTTEGPVWGFTTISPPSEPSALYPPDGHTDVNRSISLSWVGDDPNDDTVTYDVYFQEGASSPSIRICEGITATTCKPCDQTPCHEDDVLNENTHYSWKVVARRFGLTTEGPVWGFTTGTDWEIPEFITYSGNVSSAYYAGAGHDYPLYARLSLVSGAVTIVTYSDPFTGYFEIEQLPTGSQVYTVTVTSLIEGHQDRSFAFAHGGQDSLGNVIHVAANIMSDQGDCAPGYELGSIGGGDVIGCVPIPGGVVAGYVYDGLLPVKNATVMNEDLSISVDTFPYDEIGDLSSLGLYWLFQPTATDPRLVGFSAFSKSNPFLRDSRIVEVLQSKITRQDFHLELYLPDF